LLLIPNDQQMICGSSIATCNVLLWHFSDRFAEKKEAAIFMTTNQNMTRKTTNIVYWVCTIIFAGLMIFSAVGGIQPTKEAIQLMHDYLGYPIYFIQFISVAKLLGSIAILIPTRSSIKEWAYAGLFFDLLGAIFSGIAVSNKFDPMMLTLLAWVIPGVVSYWLWKRNQHRVKEVTINR
jgi:hypothetical protein